MNQLVTPCNIKNLEGKEEDKNSIISYEVQNVKDKFSTIENTNGNLNIHKQEIIDIFQNKYKLNDIKSLNYHERVQMNITYNNKVV